MENTAQNATAYHRILTSNGASTIKNGRRSTRQSALIHFSENEEESEEDVEEEEESEEDDEEEDVEDEELEDDDEELEDDEHSYEEDEENQFPDGINLGIQTSPGLDDTDSGMLNGGGARFRGGSTGGSPRFISSTPTPAVKSTSTYFNSPHPQDSSLRGITKNKPAFALNSPLRRHVAGNSKAYGSLGEALASLPMSGQRNHSGLSHSSTTWSNIPSSSSNSHPVARPSTTNSNNYFPSHGGASVNASDVTTQVSRGSNQNINAQNTSASYNNNTRSTYCTSQNISKLIIVMAGIFFLVLSYKYATLRPSIDIERLVCIDEPKTKDAKSAVYHSCVPKEIETEVTNITRDFVNILETRSIEVLCNIDNDNSKNNSLSVTEILQIFNEDKMKEAPKLPYEKQVSEDNKYDIKSNGFDNEDYIRDIDDEEDIDEPFHKQPIQNIESSNYHNKFDSTLKKNVQLILSLIHENPQWGIKISCDSVWPCTKTYINKETNNIEEEEDYGNAARDKDEMGFNFDETYLSLDHPPINWDCWFRIRASSTYHILLSLLVKLFYLSIVVLLAYGVYRLYCWRQEKRIREEQDIFELVEQVLSMLVAQHQQYHALAAAANVSQGSSSNLAAKPCLAINHIRDQLIPPTVSKHFFFFAQR